MFKYRHHKYTWSKPHTNANHDWRFVGPRGGVNFHVSENAEYGDSAGIEYHFFEPRHYQRGQAPSHTDCPLTGGRCWHDGSSLYAIESIWPMVKPMLQRGDHEAIFRYLESEATAQFDTEYGDSITEDADKDALASASARTVEQSAPQPENGDDQ